MAVRRVPGGAKSTPTRKSFNLPTKAIDPPKNLTDYAIFLYGLKGVGKTTLANMFPNAVTLMLEPRRRNIKIRQVPEIGQPQLTWPDIVGYTQEIAKQGNVTCVVDSIDIAHQLCVDYVCGLKNLKYPPENDYGKTWVEIREEFASTFNALLFADIPVIFTSHAKLRQDDDYDDTPTEEAKYAAPTCAPAAWKYAKQVCDFAFYYGYYEKKRALTVRGNDGVWAASGTENNFLDPNGNQITTFFTGETPSAAFKSLNDAFNNKLFDVQGPPAPKVSISVKRKVR